MQSLTEHLDVVQMGLLGLICVLGYFIKRAFNEIHENMNKLGELLRQLSDEFHTLQGEHNVMKQQHTERSCQ